MKKILLLAICLFPTIVWSQKYKVRAIASERIEVTAALDSTPHARAMAIVAPYTPSVDSVMMPPLGLSRTAMTAGRPESLLGNWVADVMVETSTATGLDRADFGVMNVGGLRNNMPEGIVRRGDVMLISPFQNYVVVLEMKGSDVEALFKDIAAVHGEAVSASVRLEISKDGQLLSATIDGKPIDKDRTYRDNDRVAYTIAKKQVGEYTVYCVPVRGTGGNAEWFSDFHLGQDNGGVHEGFRIAAQ